MLVIKSDGLTGKCVHVCQGVSLCACVCVCLYMCVSMLWIHLHVMDVVWEKLHVLSMLSSSRCSITTLNQARRRNTVLPLVFAISTAQLIVKLIDARELHTRKHTHTHTHKCRLKIAAALPFCRLSCWGTHPLPRWSPAHRCWSVPWSSE